MVSSEKTPGNKFEEISSEGSDRDFDSKKSKKGSKLPEKHGWFKKHSRPGFLIIAGFSMLALVLITSTLSRLNLEEAEDWVTHTAQVQAEINALLSAMQDAETGQRGFLITGGEQYLEPYNSALSDTPSKLESLRQLTSDNPFQQENIARVEDLVAEKFAELDETIQLRREGGFEAALPIVQEDTGKIIMDNIRALIAIMTAEEARLMIIRQADLQKSSEIITFIEISGFLLLIAIGYFSIQKVYQSLAEKEKRLELLAYSSGLEKMVEQRTSELQKSNEELKKFAYVASHDLRAPLRAIDQLSQWIEEDLEGKLEGETQENMDLLRGRVRRLEKLLDDILRYSRASRAKGEPVEIKTFEFLTELQELFIIPEGFSIKLDKNLPTVRAPEGALDQIFGNLINNALNHHDKKSGKITISAKEKGKFWEFSVADDGPGIAKEYHDKIFDMFKKLEGRDQTEGSGMGLAIVKKLVTNQDGRVSVWSEEGKRGTTFKFTWPKDLADKIDTKTGG